VSMAMADEFREGRGRYPKEAKGKALGEAGKGRGKSLGDVAHRL
jgi:hypothetical protein